MQKLLTMLGFAIKSGNIITGDDTCEMYMKKGRVYLLIVAADASDNTKDKFRFLTAKQNVRLFEISTKEELSQAIGKYNRAVFGVTNRKFASALKAILEETAEKPNGGDSIVEN